jgi:hypothetical protein
MNGYTEFNETHQDHHHLEQFLLLFHQRSALGGGVCLSLLKNKIRHLRRILFRLKSLFFFTLQEGGDHG